MVKIAVCDDSRDYGEIITEIIKKAVENRNCKVSTFYSGQYLIQAFKEELFDIIFLDMEMPELNGIETGLKIRELSDKVIIFYLTSHKEFAYDSYSVKAKGYILKPANFSIIEKVLLESIDEIRKEIKYLDVKDATGIIHRIHVGQITQIQRKKEDRKLHIYCLDNKEIIVSQTLEYIKEKLSKDNNIVRSSKSCLVNLNNIKEINKNVVIFINNEKEEVSRRCLVDLVAKFNFQK